MTQRMDYNAATPVGVKALGGVYNHILQSGLPKALVNLVYLRVCRSTAAPTASICIRVTS